MVWNEKQRSHFAALSRIFTVDRCGTVGGVEFDLRDDLLDPAEWQPPVVGLPPGVRSPDSEGPFIWFPWFGEFDKEEVRRGGLAWVARTVEFSGSANTLVTQPERKQLLDQHIRLHTPDCIVRAGDKIIIRKIDCRKSVGEFEHPHDSEVRLVYLRVNRATKKIYNIRLPIKFTGTRSIFIKDGDIDVHAVILKRICEHFKIAEIDEFDYRLNDNSDANRAASIALFLHDDLEALRVCLGEGDTSSPQYCEADKQIQLANSSVLLGYCWARAELELKMKPLALAALRMKAGSALGGSKGVETRRKKAEVKWRRDAKQIAIEFRNKEPSASQTKVASEILFLWRGEDLPPCHETLKKYVAKLERDGQLAKRVSKSR